MSIGPLAFSADYGDSVVRDDGTRGAHVFFEGTFARRDPGMCLHVGETLGAYPSRTGGGDGRVRRWPRSETGGVDRGDVGSGRTRSILTDGLWVGYRRRPRGRMPNVCRGASHRGSRGSVLVAEQAVYSGFLQVGHRNARMVGPEMLFTHLKRTLMKSLERLAPSIRKRQSASMFSS